MKRGFTLIEVLVALAISLLVMVSILGSLDSTRRAVDAIHNVIETESAGPKILELLTRDLDAIAVYNAGEFRVLLGEDDTIAGADADRLDLIVHLDSSVPQFDPVLEENKWAPLLEVGWVLRQHPTKSDFLQLFRREDFLMDEDPFRDGTFTLLYERMVHFDLGYYARPEFDPLREEEWDSYEREALPWSVEIQMELEIEPRTSRESVAILGANRARLAFEDLLVIPESSRWLLRKRLHPVVPGEEEPSEGGATSGGEAAQNQLDLGASGLGGEFSGETGKRP